MKKLLNKLKCFAKFNILHFIAVITEQTINDYMKQKRVPIHANLELTHVCNFKCVHCYQTPMKNSKLEELSFYEWKKIIDTLKSKGTIFMTLIGGEVF